MRFISLTFVLVWTAAVSAAGVESSRPNILLILIDDLGWMDLQCQGNPHVSTPRIDALAGSGIRFTDAYAAAPVCSPTRAAILTGLAPARLGITNHLPDQKRFIPEDSVLLPAGMEDHLALEHVTLAERLKNDAGYATGFFGKWHLYVGKESQFGPLAQGFDINIGGCSYGGPPTFFDPYGIDFLPDRKPGEYLPDRLVDETLSFIRQSKQKSQPFFAALFTYTVHWPMEAPEELLAKYRDRPVEGYRDYRYAAMIEAMDNAMGRLLDSLDDLELTDDTLVIFTSDNGPFGGVGDPTPLRAEKGYLYEGGIRVPLIARWPGHIKPDTVSSIPVISMDLYPTVLEAAGLTPLPQYPGDGLSLLPILSGQDAPDRDAIFWHYPNFAFHRGNRLGSAVRAGRYKLIEYFDDNSVELYDLKADLSETKNLADSMPDRAARLKRRLHNWRNDTRARLPRKRL